MLRNPTLVCSGKKGMGTQLRSNGCYISISPMVGQQNGMLIANVDGMKLVGLLPNSERVHGFLLIGLDWDEMRC